MDYLFRLLEFQYPCVVGGHCFMNNSWATLLTSVSSGPCSWTIFHSQSIQSMLPIMLKNPRLSPLSRSLRRFAFVGVPRYYSEYRVCFYWQLYHKQAFIGHPSFSVRAEIPFLLSEIVIVAKTLQNAVEENFLHFVPPMKIYIIEH